MSNATIHATGMPTTVDAQEIARFNALASAWWNPNGPSKALFALNPARLTYVRDQLCAAFARDVRSRTPLAGLRLLDLGCGGGLVSEPLARLGAEVVGVDAAAENIAIAQNHAAAMELAIDYRATTAETLVADGEQFDAVISLEVVEHVADVPLFLKSCAALLRPDGRFVFSTLNRTAASYATAIIGAEYLLRLVPRGTHAWRKFITPDEMQALLKAASFTSADISGLSLNLANGAWHLSSNSNVNYIGCAARA
jgi:2-polyprenyl-6-hydroxyphenyl methylase / 3-demethylubiquinone-9 3-methyltransferase